MGHHQGQLAGSNVSGYSDHRFCLENALGALDGFPCFFGGGAQNSNKRLRAFCGACCRRSGVLGSSQELQKPGKSVRTGLEEARMAWFWRVDLKVIRITCSIRV